MLPSFSWGVVGRAWAVGRGSWVLALERRPETTRGECRHRVVVGCVQYVQYSRWMDRIRNCTWAFLVHRSRVRVYAARLPASPASSVAERPRRACEADHAVSDRCTQMDVMCLPPPSPPRRSLRNAVQCNAGRNDG